MARDAAQITVLLAVDYLFLRWTDARIPMLDRHASLRVLEAANAIIAGHLWWTRILLPKWTAHRIATTWSRAERARFERPLR